MNSERLLPVFAQLVLIAGIFSQVIHACSDPNPPENMVVDRFKSGKLSVTDRFSIGEVAYFKCKDSYMKKGVWWTLKKTCKGNDTWVWDSRVGNIRRAYCIKICMNGTFACRNGQTIPCSKRCDCNPDCSDGSDEGYRAKCGPYIMVNVTGKRSGTLKSPGYPHGYPGQLSCTYKIFTSDPKDHVSLDFNVFDLRSSTSATHPLTKLSTEYCKDYIKLRKNKYSSIYTIRCSGWFDYGSCSAWCGRSSPPESRSKSNYILLEFHTSTSTRKHKGFSASWTNEVHNPPPKWTKGNERPTDVFAHTRHIDADQKPIRNGDHDHNGDGDDHDYDDGNGSRGRHNDGANRESNNLRAGAKTIIVLAATVAFAAIAAVFAYWRRRRLSTPRVSLHHFIGHAEIPPAVEIEGLIRAGQHQYSANVRRQ